MTPRRAVTRAIHVVLGVLLAAYVYVPDGDVSDVLRTILVFGGTALVAVSGFWLWKGPAVLRAVRGTRS